MLRPRSLSDPRSSYNRRGTESSVGKQQHAAIVGDVNELYSVIATVKHGYTFVHFIQRFLKVLICDLRLTFSQDI